MTCDLWLVTVNNKGLKCRSVQLLEKVTAQNSSNFIVQEGIHPGLPWCVHPFSRCTTNVVTCKELFLCVEESIHKIFTRHERILMKFPSYACKWMLLPETFNRRAKGMLWKHETVGNGTKKTGGNVADRWTGQNPAETVRGFKLAVTNKQTTVASGKLKPANFFREGWLIMHARDFRPGLDLFCTLFVSSQGRRSFTSLDCYTLLPAWTDELWWIPGMFRVVTASRSFSVQSPAGKTILPTKPIFCGFECVGRYGKLFVREKNMTDHKTVFSDCMVFAFVHHPWCHTIDVPGCTILPRGKAHPNVCGREMKTLESHGGRFAT